MAQALQGFNTEEIAVYPEYDELRDAVVTNLLEGVYRAGLQPVGSVCLTVPMRRSMRCSRLTAMRGIAC